MHLKKAIDILRIIRVTGLPAIAEWNSAYCSALINGAPQIVYKYKVYDQDRRANNTSCLNRGNYKINLRTVLLTDVLRYLELGVSSHI